MKEIESAVRSSLVSGKLPCSTAHRAAEEGGWTPAAVGEEATGLEVKISRCQLGLFGYRDFGQKGIAERFSALPEELEAALRAAAKDGKIGCAELWRVAAARGLPRVAAGRAAETLELSVSPCQLGCF